MSRRWPLLLAAALLGCQPAGGVAEVGLAITGGTEAPTDPAVVALIDRRVRCNDQDLRISCSGTLISPRVVLTAAHCVRERSGYEVYLGSPVGSDPAGRFAVVVDIAVHPGWDASTHAYDLALLRLADPVATPPLAIGGALEASLLGTTVRAVGFGVTAPGALADGLRRQGTLRVTELQPEVFKAAPSPANTCGGDSGGPVLADRGSGEQLVGVTVSGDPLCELFAVNARVDLAIDDFIRPYLDATEAAPEGWDPAATLPLDRLCETPCGPGAACPAALTCFPGQPGQPATCGLAAAPANWGAACDDDLQCGDGQQCRRLWPDGAGACRCARPCAGGVPPIPKPGGCELLAARRPIPPVAALLVLSALAFGWRRARRASRP